jgi:hypothetical protein
MNTYTIQFTAAQAKTITDTLLDLRNQKDYDSQQTQNEIRIRKSIDSQDPHIQFLEQTISRNTARTTEITESILGFFTVTQRIEAGFDSFIELSQTEVTTIIGALLAKLNLIRNIADKEFYTASSEELTIPKQEDTLAILNLSDALHAITTAAHQPQPPKPVAESNHGGTGEPPQA